ncbi:MAG: hypothetical protein COS87_02875 [Chloroflexi bacterium CG07_land_8_20_14_0_80_45_17]|nr:MAG: hypothetical protein COX14_03425 [Chloroflexi bacterium CG23_combo_of_CG06-09_8_20_14_all_45_10]PIU56188.1 MAG: hypothetical protein COS87_02875 [Chloroflexi bacterium CG07_land_8_20_14_0_80_45_17]
MDPHQNIFYYYRGPSKYKTDEMQIARQLENNTTKALINLFQYSPPKVLSRFLELVASKTGYDNFPVPQKNNYKFALQKIPELAKSAESKVVVTISKELLGESGVSPGGIPDAWIYCPSTTPSVAIMIEAKLKGIPSQDQIQGHLEKAGWNNTRLYQCNLTWAEIYDCWANEKNDLLTTQFRQYLEVIGMSPFSGFVDDDFNFFISYDDDYRPLLRNKLHEFAQEVHKRMGQEITRVYSEIFVGHIIARRGTAFVVLRKPQDRHDPFKHCNFSIEINKRRSAV